MPTLKQIQQQILELSRAEREVLRDWLENLFEDDLEMTDQFKAKIAEGEQELRRSQ